MDGNNKKNGIIRLLGKLGRRVKFLRVPLTVIVVIGASVKALFKRLFFDMSYHKIRMRVGVGAVCAALVATLFVIPAIAGDADILSTVFESLSSEEEASPSPSPSEDEETYSGLNFDPDQEVADEGAGADDGQNDGNTDAEPTDVDDDNSGENVGPDDKSEDGDTNNNGDNDDEDIINPNAIDLKDRGPALKTRGDTIVYEVTSVTISKVEGGTAETTPGELTTYTFGEIGNNEKFKVAVSGTKKVGEEDAVAIDFSDSTDKAQLQYNWTLTPNTNNVLPATSTPECTIPSGGRVYAGDYKLLCNVNVKGKIPKESNSYSIKVKKVSLQPANLSYAKSGLSKKYYYAESQEESGIPGSVPAGAFLSTVGNITATFEYHKATGNAIENNPWSVVDNYYPMVSISEADNYEAGSILFAEGTSGTQFSVEYYTDAVTPYAMDPKVADGSEVEGDTDYSWRKKATSITAVSGYELSVDGTTYSSDAIGPFESNANKQSVSHIYAKKIIDRAKGIKSPVWDSSTNSQKEFGPIAFYVDKDLPTGDITFSPETPTPGADEGYYGGNVSFEIESNDEHSGVKKTYYAFSNKAVAETGLSSLNWKEGKSGVVNATEYPGGEVFVYVKIEDKAGNVGYVSDKSKVKVSIDTMKPTFWSSSGRQIAEGSEIDYYIDEDNTAGKVITVKEAQNGDSGIKSITAVGADVDSFTQGDTEVGIKISPPKEEANEEASIVITVTDRAGNESKITVNSYLARLDIDKAGSAVKFGTKNGKIDVSSAGDPVKGEDYGYVADSLETPIVLKKKKTGGKSDVDLVAKITDAKLKDEANSKFVISGSKPSFTIKPKEKLPVVNDGYKDVIQIEYDLVQADTQDILSEHTVYIDVSFNVFPKELTLEYPGSDELYHTFPGSITQGNETWFDRFTVSGFVYGETQETSEVKKLSVGVASEPKKEVTISNVTDGGGVITDDGYVIDKGTLKFTIADNVQAGSSGKPGYNYYYPKGTFNGYVTCKRRRKDEFKGVAYTITQADGKGPHTGPDGYEWYTDNVTFKAEDGYKIRDLRKDSSEEIKSTADTTDKYTPYDVESAENNTTVAGKFEASLNVSYKDESTDNDTPKVGIIKYFEVYNTKTGEVSDLIREAIYIDKTSPSQMINGEGGVDDKDIDTGAPYFHIESNTWREFLHNVTLKMYFNDTMQVTVENVYDNASEVATVEYMLSPTDYADGTGKYKKDDLDKGKWHVASENPASTSVSFYITEKDVEEGYIYIRITNNAGLSSYLTTDRMIIFDNDGPKITSNYDGEDEVGSHVVGENEDKVGSHVVKNGERFVAEEVEITVYDKNLHDPANKTITGPAVEIYRGTDISGGPEGNENFVYKFPGKAGTTSWTYTLDYNKRPEQIYTVVARDDSGFVTVRYFSVVKPSYDVKAKDIGFDIAEYGYKADNISAKTIEWDNLYKKDGLGEANAKAIIQDVIVTEGKDEEGKDKFVVSRKDGKTGTTKDPGAGWTIKPVEGLHAGTHTAKLKLKYLDVDDETKYTTPVTATFTVDKKELTATYLGETIKRGKKPDTSSDKIKVTGFIDGEGEDTGSNVKKAKGYVKPVIEVPADIADTTVIKPKNGKADDYKFNYAGGVLTVETNKAVKDTHYTVSGTLSDTGWYISNITISPKEGYELTSDMLGKVTMPNIVITKDTELGTVKFYIKDKTTGEMFDETTFSYKKDVVAPVITGVNDGASYEDNKKAVIATDDYLSSVTVNGLPQNVTTGKEFYLEADQKEKIFFIVAMDRAGHMTTANVTLTQEDGVDDDDEEGSDYNPDDDTIQDDTDGNDGDAGEVKKYVELVDGAPKTAMTSTIKQLKSSVLTSGERSAVKEGSDADITLRVQDISGSVSQTDKEVVIAALGDFKVARYYDVTLWSEVGNGEKKQITDANSSISFTMTIPSELRAVAASKVREFAMVRVHNGSASVLQDRDSSANTVTVNTSRFSVYALAYRDVDASSASSGSGSGSKSSGSSSGGNGNTTGLSGSGGSGYSGGSGSGGRNYGVETDGVVDGSPQTGDDSPVVPAAIGFGVALLGMIAIIIIKRHMDYEWVYVDENGEVIEGYEDENSKK